MWLIVVLSIGLNLLVDLFAYIVTDVFVCPWHAVDVYLELLLLC